MTDSLAGYDEIPYESFPITETHPDRLAVIGRFFGLDSPDPTRARVLELGCASGGNLLPIAWFHPLTQCLGLELSRSQAFQGMQWVDALGLSNAEIRHQDIMDFPAQGEPFDFIIVHGVFSWVPPKVREHILAVCGQRLAPGGIAYISYNTLPGGRQRSMLRDMLLHHARDRGSPRERLAAARDMLEFLATPLDSSPRGHDWVRHEVQRLRAARDSYLYHEYLEETNEAFLFSEMVRRASRHGLQYLADAQLHTMFPSTLGEAAESSLARFDDLVEEEQYADFLRLRGFRQSLFCRDSEPLTRDVDLDSLLALPLYTDLIPDEDGGYRGATGQHFEPGTPLLRAVIERLGESFPQGQTLAGVLPEVHHRLTKAGTPTSAQDLSRLGHELFNLFISGGVQATLSPAGTGTRPRPDTCANTGPQAARLARVLADGGENLIPTPRHQTLQLDPISVRLLPLLDGQRDPAAVVEAMMAAAARDSALTRLLRKGTPEAIRGEIGSYVRETLTLLDRHGLITDH